MVTVPKVSRLVIKILSVAGKLLPRVMLNRLLTYVVDTVVPESQCGFRRVLAFIDLTKAFDTGNCDLLWQVLGKFGCPPYFLSILREFHTDMSACVVQGGEKSKSFGVNTGVKQIGRAHV